MLLRSIRMLFSNRRVGVLVLLNLLLLLGNWCLFSSESSSQQLLTSQVQQLQQQLAQARAAAGEVPTTAAAGIIKLPTSTRAVTNPSTPVVQVKSNSQEQHATGGIQDTGHIQDLGKEGQQANAGGIQGQQANAGGIQGQQANAGGIQGQQANAGGTQGQQANAGGIQGQQANAGGIQGQQANAGGIQGQQANVGGKESKDSNRGSPYSLTDQNLLPGLQGGTVHPDYAALRKGYKIPNIEYTNLVNCEALFNNSTAELAKARSVLLTKPKVPIYEETYIKWLENCDEFKQRRGYITVPLTAEEEAFPLAFSISMYTDVEHTERLLRAIYQPQNLYCIHIDIKSSLLLHRTIRHLTGCFNNVFIASHLDKIKWGDVSVLLPALNCMRDFDRYYRGRWKYYINLTGQELPLRSNWELVQIAKIFNGSNDIAGSTKRMEMDRVNHIWKHRWSKTYQQTIFFDTTHPKAPPAHNLTFYKGELHGLFTQRMVSYIVNSNVSKDYLVWCWDSGHPSEHYWNTLNYNVHLAAPGGYQGPQDLADEYSFHPAIRAKHWQDLNYGTRECQGKLVRGICIYGVGDVPWLAHRQELFANKFHLTYEYLAYDCMEQRHRERVRQGAQVAFDAEYFKNLPTVKYSRKDGYFTR